MSYTPIGNTTVQDYVDKLSEDDEFNNLSSDNQLQCVNFGQQLCATISKENNLSFYRVTDYMAIGV